jgi:hypothetical protein
MNVEYAEAVEGDTEKIPVVRHYCAIHPDGTVDTTKAVCGFPRPADRPIRRGAHDVDCVVCLDLWGRVFSE